MVARTGLIVVLNVHCLSCLEQFIKFIAPTKFKVDWSLYTCLTQLYGGTDMYNLLHKEQLHVSAFFIGHLRVYK